MHTSHLLVCFPSACCDSNPFRFVFLTRDGEVQMRDIFLKSEYGDIYTLGGTIHRLILIVCLPSSVDCTHLLFGNVICVTPGLSSKWVWRFKKYGDATKFFRSSQNTTLDKIRLLLSPTECLETNRATAYNNILCKTSRAIQIFKKCSLKYKNNINRGIR